MRPDREGGTRTPAQGHAGVAAVDDVYTNHIHADDLRARVCRPVARQTAAHQHVNDDTQLKMG
jgi:hypothetical protein